MRLVVSSISFETFSFSSSHDAGFVGCDEIGDLLLQRFASGAQFVVGKGFYGRVDGFDLFEIRLDLLAVLVGFGAEDEFD